MKKKTGPSGETRHPETHRQTNNGRRGALKRLVLGSAAAGVAASLPARWTQPIVQSVMLPAHAQTSPGDIADGDFFADLPDLGSNFDRFGRTGTEVASQSGWLDWLIPSAHAGVRPPPVGECLPCGFCARIRNGRVTLVAAGVSIDEGNVCYEATGSIGEAPPFQQVAGPGGACTDPVSVPIQSLEGEAPNRTLVLGAGSDTLEMNEDPSRSCSCGAIECLVFPENCLLHGTPVLLPDGGSRGIETLAVGDIVAALDRGTGSVKPAVVTKLVTDHMRGEYWRVNDSLLITNDHPVLAADESGLAWRRVDNLAEGMEIQGVHGRTTIVSLERVSERARTVYMETTADNFIATPGGTEYVVKAGYGTAFQRSRAEEESTVHA